MTDMLPGDELAGTRSKAGQPVIVPATARDRGIGPFKRLVLRGVLEARAVGDAADGVAEVVEGPDRRGGRGRGRRGQDQPVRLGNAVVGEAGPVGRGVEAREAEEARAGGGGRSGRRKRRRGGRGRRAC